MFKTSKTNWQPEHFPMGTIVHLEGYKRVVMEDRTEFHTDYSDTFHKIGADVIVTKVIQNGRNNWLIQTTDRNEGCDMQHVFHFDHITSIMKRGTGPLNVEYIGDRAFKLDTKRQLSNKNLFNKSRYYWMSGQEIVWFLVRNSHLNKALSLQSGFIEFFMKQSFVKTEFFDHDTGHRFRFFSVSKKKARRFVQQNVNRWIKPMKQAVKEAEEEAEFYYRDCVSDFDNIPWPVSTNQSEQVEENVQDDAKENTPLVDTVSPFCALRVHDTGVSSLGQLLRKKLDEMNNATPLGEMGSIYLASENDEVLSD